MWQKKNGTFVFWQLFSQILVTVVFLKVVPWSYLIPLDHVIRSRNMYKLCSFIFPCIDCKFSDSSLCESCDVTLLKELRNYIHALFVCSYYFVQYGFMQVCISYQFFWKTSSCRSAFFVFSARSMLNSM